MNGWTANERMNEHNYGRSDGWIKGHTFEQTEINLNKTKIKTKQKQTRGKRKEKKTKKKKKPEELNKKIDLIK